MHCPPHTIIYFWKALNVYFPMPLEADQLELHSSIYTPSKVQRSVGLTAGCHHVRLCTLRGSFLPQFQCPPCSAIYAWKALDSYFPMLLESPHLELCSSSYSCWKYTPSGCCGVAPTFAKKLEANVGASFFLQGVCFVMPTFAKKFEANVRSSFSPKSLS